MKTKTAVLALAALFGAGASACSDLKEVPITGVTGQYFQTVDGANAAVTGAYGRLRDVYGRQNEVTMMQVGTDSWEKGGEIGAEAPFNDYTSVLAPNMSVTTNRDYFQALYAAVNAANTAIAAVDAAPLSAADKPVRSGEARFLRALYYHDLVRLYGDVELRLEPSEGVVIAATRTPKAEIYSTGIVPDLEYAVANLPAAQSQYGRATKGAAQMLLAEVLLTRGESGDFDRAVQLTSDVINSGTYALNADFRSIFCGPDRTAPTGVVISACDFVPANETNREFIYSVQFSGDGVNDQYGNWLHLMYTAAYDIQGAPNLPRTLEYGRPYRRLRPTLHLLRLWNRTTDSRYDATFQNLWTSATGTRDTALFMPGTPTVAAQYQGKRYRAFGENDYTPVIFPTLRKWLDQTRTDAQSIVGGRDRHLFRLADAYLLRAEANIRAGRAASAVADFNVLRRRAARAGQNNELTAADLASLTADPVAFLLDERERELAGEESRWFTLTRLTNVGGKNYFLTRIQAYNSAAAGNVKAFHALRPIPQEQIDRTEGGSASFAQNPGY